MKHLIQSYLLTVMVNSETKINIIHEHYRETFSVISEAIKRRDRLMLFVVVILGFFAFQSISPILSNQIVTDLLSFKFGLNLKVDLSIIRNVIWAFLLIFSIRYFQVAVFIERQYAYIHQLEDKLNKEVGDELITREGKSYLHEYPWFSNWICYLYTLVFPLLLLVVSGYGLVKGFDGMCSMSINEIFDFLIYLLLVISTVLYLGVIHIKRKK